MDLGARITAARNAVGMSREQLAGALGMSLSTVIRYESGGTRNISLARLEQVAHVTGQPLSYFISERAA